MTKVSETNLSAEELLDVQAFRDFAGIEISDISDEAIHAAIVRNRAKLLEAGDTLREIGFTSSNRLFIRMQ